MKNPPAESSSSMAKETKFGYGFLLAGAGLPYLIDKLLGPIVAVIVAAVCFLAGIGFLVAGHLHDKNKSRKRRGLMATIGMFTLVGAASGAVIGSITGAIWNIAHRTIQSDGSTESATKNPQQTEQKVPKLTIKASSFAGGYGPRVVSIAGVAWKPIYTDVRLSIENQDDEDYVNVDLLISSDLMTIYPTQITRLPAVTLIPEPAMKNLPPAAVIGQDAQGKDVVIPTSPSTADAGILAKRYRLLCSNLPHGAKMELLLPSIATNKFTGDDPNKYFAPKRDAKEVTVTGQFLVAGKKQTVDQTVVPTPGLMSDSNPPAITHQKQITQPETGFHERIDGYYFSLGENGITTSATVEGLKKGYTPFSGFPVTVFAKENDDKIHYSVRVWNGLMPVQITDGEFSTEPNWDRNFDETTLEIVDENQKPVLQLIWKTPSHLIVNGVFKLQDGTVVIADQEGWRPMRASDSIKPLFKYPSRRFKGQYAN